MNDKQPPNILVPEIKNNFKNVKTTFIAFGILFLTVTAVLWPLATIWSINTLFNLSIGYTFWTWLACWILIFSLSLTIKNTKK